MQLAPAYIKKHLKTRCNRQISCPKTAHTPEVVSPCPSWCGTLPVIGRSIVLPFDRRFLVAHRNARWFKRCFHDLLCLILMSCSAIQCNTKVAMETLYMAALNKLLVASFIIQIFKFVFRLNFQQAATQETLRIFFLDTFVIICWPPQPFAARMLKVVAACSLRVVGKMPETWPWLVCLGQHWISNGKFQTGADERNWRPLRYWAVLGLISRVFVIFCDPICVKFASLAGRNRCWSAVAPAFCSCKRKTIGLGPVTASGPSLQGLNRYLWDLPICPLQMQRFRWAAWQQSNVFFPWVVWGQGSVGVYPVSNLKGFRLKE